MGDDACCCCVGAGGGEYLCLGVGCQLPEYLPCSSVDAGIPLLGMESGGLKNIALLLDMGAGGDGEVGMGEEKDVAALTALDMATVAAFAAFAAVMGCFLSKSHRKVNNTKPAT